MTTLPVRTALLGLTAATLFLTACQGADDQAAAPPPQAATTAPTPAPSSPTQAPTPSATTPEIRTSEAPDKPDTKLRKPGEVKEGLCALVKPEAAGKKLGKLSGVSTIDHRITSWPFHEACALSYEKSYVSVEWSATELTDEDWAWYRSAHRSETAKDNKVSDGAWVDEYGTLTFFGGGRIMSVTSLVFRDAKSVEPLAKEMLRVADQVENLPEHITRPECDPGAKGAVEILGGEPTIVRQSMVNLYPEKGNAVACGWSTDLAAVTVTVMGSAKDDSVTYFWDNLPNSRKVKGVGKRAVVSAEMGTLFFETGSGRVVRVEASESEASEKQLVALAKAMTKTHK